MLDKTKTDFNPLKNKAKPQKKETFELFWSGNSFDFWVISHFLLLLLAITKQTHPVSHGPCLFARKSRPHFVFSLVWNHWITKQPLLGLLRYKTFQNKFKLPPMVQLTPFPLIPSQSWSEASSWKNQTRTPTWRTWQPKRKFLVTLFSTMKVFLASGFLILPKNAVSPLGIPMRYHPSLTHEQATQYTSLFSELSSVTRKIIQRDLKDIAPDVFLISISHCLLHCPKTERCWDSEAENQIRNRIHRQPRYFLIWEFLSFKRSSGGVHDGLHPRLHRRSHAENQRPTPGLGRRERRSSWRRKK